MCIPPFNCCGSLARDRDAGRLGNRHILHDKSAAHGSESSFNLGEVGAIVGIEELPDSVFFKVELFAKGLFGDSLISHGAIDSELGCDQRRYGNHDLALGGEAGGGDVLVIVGVEAESHTETVLSHFDCLIPRPPTSIGTVNIREAHYIAFSTSLSLLFFIKHNVARIGIPHGLEFLPVDIQVSKHTDQQPRTNLPVFNGGSVLIYEDSAVAALTKIRVKAIIQPILSCVAPCPPHEFAAIHLVILAHALIPAEKPNWYNSPCSEDVVLGSG